MRRRRNSCMKIDYGGIDAAMERIARRYDLRAALRLCPYISKRIGIAEWIVACDMMRRYRRG